MREQSQNYYFGLDIGTSVVRCVIGSIDHAEGAELSIVGHGSAPNMGMRKGSIVHVEDVADAIRSAIDEAERVSGITVRQATVNINGNHVLGLNSRGVVAISAANRAIDNEDRLRVDEAAAIIQMPPNREIVQIFARSYRLDGQDNIKDPVGMQGVRLEVDTHIVTAATPNLRNLDIAMDKAGVSIKNYTLSSLASAEAVLNRQQKEAGTLLLNIGAGTTNMVVVEDGEIQHVAVLPVGGMNITNDLAIGLRTDLDIAELVKVQHASLSPTPSHKSRVAVQYEGKMHQFDAEEVRMITEARVDELLELVDKELRKIQKSRKLPGGIVLVGGSALLPGIADFAKEKLQLSARVGRLQPLGGVIDTVNDPSYSTAVGLVLLDMLLISSNHGHPTGKPNSNAFGLIENLLNRITKKAR
ncbi:MAG: cell division protein FtsA [Candidatus Saccharibacteria bacterium]